MAFGVLRDRHGTSLIAEEDLCLGLYVAVDARDMPMVNHVEFLQPATVRSSFIPLKTTAGEAVTRSSWWSDQSILDKTVLKALFTYYGVAHWFSTGVLWRTGKDDNPSYRFYEALPLRHTHNTRLTVLVINVGTARLVILQNNSISQRDFL